MQKNILWSQEDLALLKVWCDENPNVVVYKKNVPITLQRLFPDRSGSALSGRVRIVRWSAAMAALDPGSCIKNKAVASSFADSKGYNDGITPPFTKTHLMHVIFTAMDTTIEQYIKERVVISTSLIMKENAEMKLLLQKLTKIREAIVDFKL